MLTEKVTFLQKVAIFLSNKVLVIKRKNDDLFLPGAWDLPGGKSEWPQSDGFVENPHLDDVVREVKEETRIELEKAGLKPVAVFSGYSPELNRYTIIIGWVYNLSRKPTKIFLTEHEEYRWLEVDKAKSLDFGKGGDYLRKIIAESSILLKDNI